MKLWTNNTNSIHKVDDNMLYPRNTYVLPDELTGPTWDDSVPCPHKIKPYYKGRAAGGATAVYRAGHGKSGRGNRHAQRSASPSPPRECRAHPPCTCDTG